MKQTKVTPFKVISILLTVLALGCSFVNCVYNLFTNHYDFWDNAGETAFTVLYEGFPLLLMLIGFIAFYKKGKSTVIFGAAFMALALFSAGYLCQLFYHIEYIFDGVVDGFESFQHLCWLIWKVAYYILDPITVVIMCGVAAINGFCNAKFAKATIAFMALGAIATVGNNTVLALTDWIADGFDFGYMLYCILSATMVVLYCLAFIVFLVYRIKAGKDVDKAEAEYIPRGEQSEIPIVEETVASR